MKLSDAIIDAMNDIDDNYLAKSEIEKKPFSFKLIAIISSLACILVAVIIIPSFFNSKNANNSANGGAINPPTQQPNGYVSDNSSEKEGSLLTYEVKIIITDTNNLSLTNEQLQAEYQRLLDLGYNVTLQDNQLYIHIYDESTLESLPLDPNYLYNFE